MNKTLVRVAVNPLDNRSSETTAGTIFTNALVQEILGKTDTQVVDESRAEAVFIGTIQSITFHTLSRSTVESVLERTVAAVVDLKLVDADGNKLWSVQNYAVHEAYTVNANTIADESNKREALEKIAQRSAEKLISQTRVDF